MTPEDRLDRIERIAKLFARAGRRARSDLRSQDEKINILINLHIENEERFKQNEERFAKNEERFAKNEKRFVKLDAKLDEKVALVLSLHAQNEERFRQNEERFARTEQIFRENQARTDEKFVELIASQADSNRRLDSLIEIIRTDRNGNS